jgi:hypothetical protein
MPNLTYWLFGGYLAWLVVSGQYKNMLSLVTDPAWKKAAPVKTPPKQLLSGGKTVTDVTPAEAKTGVAP